MNKTNKLIKTS